MNELKHSDSLLIDYLLEDATARVRYQHEFSLAGFKTLILINGGAIIGLLTYAGNVLDRAAAHNLSSAFIFYVIGLAITTFAYVLAYAAQGSFLFSVSFTVLKEMGRLPTDVDFVATDKKWRRFGNAFIISAIVLVFGGLTCFVIGSICAMQGLL